MAHTPGPWEAIHTNETTSLVHRKTKTIDGGCFCEVTALHETKLACETARANAEPNA